MTGAPIARKIRVELKIKTAIQYFPTYLSCCDQHTPFSIPQLASHRATIDRRRELGSARIAAVDDEFCRRLHATLHSWGRSGCFPGLIGCQEIANAIRARTSELAELEQDFIDDPALDVVEVGQAVWRLIESLDITTGQSKIVSSTKTLHHLLRDLVVPIDRTYTQNFFELYNNEFQYSAQSKFSKMFAAFARIARDAGANRYVGTGEPWRTSRTKVIDNALIDFCISETYPESC